MNFFIMMCSYLLLIIMAYSLYQWPKENIDLKVKSRDTIQFILTVFIFGFVVAFVSLNTYYSYQSTLRWEYGIKDYMITNSHPDSLKMQRP